MVRNSASVVWEPSGTVPVRSGMLPVRSRTLPMGSGIVPMWPGTLPKGPEHCQWQYHTGTIPDLIGTIWDQLVEEYKQFRIVPVLALLVVGNSARAGKGT